MLFGHFMAVTTVSLPSCEVIMIKYLNLEEVVLEKSSCTLNMAEKRRSLCDPAELFRR